MSELTIHENQELEQCEAVIERGLKTFVDVGNALLTIRDKRLYRVEYGTFEDYCREKWQLERRRAYQLMDAAQVAQNVKNFSHLPERESHAAPLARLEPEQQREAWAQVVEETPKVKITGAKVQEVVDRIQERTKPQFYETTNARQEVAVTIFSSETNEYYTPPQYVEAAREVMGSIDLDPASNETAQQWIKADAYFTPSDDGLSQFWHGCVWLNPPYGTDGGESNQGKWAQRLIEEYQAGRVSAGVLLVKAALGYNWFEALWYDWPVCFARERISFIKADGSSDGQSKQGTAFFYFGPDVERFAEVFRQFGRVIMPEVIHETL